MQQCSAPHAAKAAPPSSRINSLESLCGTLKPYGVFLWDIKSPLTHWHGGTAAQSRTGIFSWNTSCLTPCAGTDTHGVLSPAGMGYPSTKRFRKFKHQARLVGREHRLQHHGERRPPRPQPTSSSISSPMVPEAVFPLKSCVSTDPRLRPRAKAIVG